ncbi:hypothetical protein ENBRE01_1652 [Enteropsectra breve]|nr:hypothetical protein ENBRE01_1652 [Enteropsectra breve]
MAQNPVKKIKLQQKPTKYFKSSKKKKDVYSVAEREVNKKTVEILKLKCKKTK